MSELLVPPVASFRRLEHGSKAPANAPPTPPSYDFIHNLETVAHGVEGLKGASKVTKEKVVNLIRPVEPPVTYLEILKFIYWSLLVILTQAWRDGKARRLYVPLLKTDFMTHYFVRCIRGSLGFQEADALS